MLSPVRALHRGAVLRALARYPAGKPDHRRDSHGAGGVLLLLMVMPAATRLA